MKRVALAAAAALVVLLGVGIGAHGAQNTLVVTAPAYVNLNTPFSVTVTVTDGTNPIPTNTDRVYVTVNRTQSNLSGLTTNGVVTINGLRATTSPVVLVVTDPARSLTKTLSIGGGTGAPPSITSTNAVSFTLNQAGSHTVTTTGSPTAQLTCTGLPGVGFPAGVTFTNLGNGTGTLAGTPAVSGTFTFVVIATNGVAPNAQQTLTLTIPAAPPPPVVRQFRSTINPIGTARHEHSSTLLLNGKVLIAGGSNAAGVVHNTALLFDPSNETFTPTATLMVQGRYSHTATRLLDGRVLLTGGYTQSSGTSPFGEIYDPNTNGFTLAPGVMSAPRTLHAASLLQDGRVLVSGGQGAPAIASADLFNPISGAFTPTNNPMSIGRHFHSSTTLQNGNVLIAGGSLGGGTLLSTSELFNPTTNTFSPTGGFPLGLVRYLHTATLLGSGFVLLTAGSDGGVYSSCLLYNPGTGTYSFTSNSLSKPRYYHQTALLQDGKVLVCGGFNSSDLDLSQAELFDPGTGIWTPITSMVTGRNQHKATTLANGDVLVTGGLNAGSALSSAELYTVPAN